MKSKEQYQLRWEKMYNLATIYYNHYGNLEIPLRFKTSNGYEFDKNGEQLGQWIGFQRNRANLTDEYRSKLLSIGMRFDKLLSKHKQQTRKIMMLEEIGFNHEEISKVINTPYSELITKLKYLESNKIPYKRNGIINEILFLSNEEIKQKYNVDIKELSKQVPITQPKTK